MMILPELPFFKRNFTFGRCDNQPILRSLSKLPLTVDLRSQVYTCCSAGGSIRLNDNSFSHPVPAGMISPFSST